MIVAIGGGLAVYEMPFYGGQTTQQFAPEAVGYIYFQIPYNFLIRTGIRMNYAWDQTHNTNALQFSQTDFRYYGELGLAYNWIVIPNIILGLGGDYQTVQLHLKPPIFAPKDNISNSNNLLTMYVQASLGFPLIKGLLVIEPFARYTITEHSSVDVFGYGFEATVQVN